MENALNRSQRESRLVASRLGFRSLEDFAKDRRRRQMAEREGEERRRELRRSADKLAADNAAISAWIARFEESRRALV